MQEQTTDEGDSSDSERAQDSQGRMTNIPRHAQCGGSLVLWTSRVPARVRRLCLALFVPGGCLPLNSRRCVPLCLLSHVCLTMPPKRNSASNDPAAAASDPAPKKPAARASSEARPSQSQTPPPSRDEPRAPAAQGVQASRAAPPAPDARASINPSAQPASASDVGSSPSFTPSALSLQLPSSECRSPCEEASHREISRSPSYPDPS